MTAIEITPTNHSPRIDFQPSGKLLIEGRAIPEDVNKLFAPLEEFISKLKLPEVVLDINMDYFNTATSKRLLEFLKIFDANKNIEKPVVNWHYEFDDDDNKEMAEIYEDCLERVSFNYIEHVELENLFEKR
ncbi:MAG: DUF1987 domain-containing protein [Bacteroidales bacterium]|nr:DUF1987 domain-containing protein [Bacteroidales bacterium]MBN2821413.1 DUF1987 domain-containing protein [Bacteroidales bacterium]